MGKGKGGGGGGGGGDVSLTKIIQIWINFHFINSPSTWMCNK